MRSFWRILEIQHQWTLPIRLRSSRCIWKIAQRIYFNDTEQARRIVANDPPQTTLTAFFKLCSEGDFAKTLLYAEVPFYFTWRDKKWNQRKKEIPVDSYIGYFKSEPVGKGLHSPSQEQRMLFSQDAAPRSSRLNLLQPLENLWWTSLRHLTRGLLQKRDCWRAISIGMMPLPKPLCPDYPVIFATSLPWCFKCVRCQTHWGSMQEA